MSKNSKCINIFEKDKKDLNLYQISILIIVFMTILQIGINSFKNNQLNEFISDYEYEKDLKTSEINTSSSNNLNKEKSKEIYSIAIIDLDKFKHYNDSYGHNVGDYILKTAVKVIKDSLKKLSYKSIFARYGGEEFIIVFDINNKKELFNSMEFIRNKINETDFSTEEYSLKATASLGGAIKEKNITLDNFIDKADKSLYKAKQTGRNKSIVD